MRGALLECDLALESKLSIYYDYHELQSQLQLVVGNGSDTGLGSCDFDLTKFGFKPPCYKVGRVRVHVGCVAPYIYIYLPMYLSIYYLSTHLIVYPSNCV